MKNVILGITVLSIHLSQSMDPNKDFTPIPPERQNELAILAHTLGAPIPPIIPHTSKPIESHLIDNIPHILLNEHRFNQYSEGTQRLLLMQHLYLCNGTYYEDTSRFQRKLTNLSFFASILLLYNHLEVSNPDSIWCDPQTNVLLGCMIANMSKPLTYLLHELPAQTKAFKKSVQSLECATCATQAHREIPFYHPLQRNALRKATKKFSQSDSFCSKHLPKPSANQNTN